MKCWRRLGDFKLNTTVSFLNLSKSMLDGCYTCPWQNTFDQRNKIQCVLGISKKKSKQTKFAQPKHIKKKLEMQPDILMKKNILTKKFNKESRM